MIRTLCILAVSITVISCQRPEVDTSDKEVLLTGAEQMNLYLPRLENKSVALVVNHTSTIGNTHLVDTLRNLGINILKVFAPEHGFRGDTDAGKSIESGVDKLTGLPIVSLYGTQKKPDSTHLSDIDIVVFDIQDVGTRFYTYISTMHYVMEACAENDVSFMVLDRPNPNGHFIDGPVRKEEFKSFVGMHPIPVVHGLTVGELSAMINDEGWLNGGLSCDLTIIPVRGYDHSMSYELPIAPSPNLPNQQSVMLYPTLCFFEGTIMSIGRGTDFPFQVVGFPDSTYGDFEFTPVSMPGKATHPKHQDRVCYGIDLRTVTPGDKIDLDLISRYISNSNPKNEFFRNYFNTLAGTETLQKQLLAGVSAQEIREGWQEELTNYKLLRKKYLLYPDFE